MVLNQSNCNLVYPVLRVSPSFGDGMRNLIEFKGMDDDELLLLQHQTNQNQTEAYQNYVKNGILSARVEWGDDAHTFHPTSNDYDQENSNAVAEIRVRGLGRRPALKEIAVQKLALGDALNGCKALNVQWNTKESHYPEYLLELVIRNHSQLILKRVLHVLPPPTCMNYNAEEIFWAPGLYYTARPKKERDDHDFLEDLFHQNQMENSNSTTSDTTPSIRRRGFGIELETVQLPPNYEKGFFTKLEEYKGMVNSMAKKYPSNNRSNNAKYGHHDVHSHQHESKEDAERPMSIWDRLLLWNIERDVQVWNATPAARMDLYEKLLASNNSTLSEENGNTEAFATIRDLVLGGPGVDQFPEPFLETLSKPPTHSHSSPEYKSPLPPHEVSHVFPPPACGYDDADREVSLLIDGILTNEQNPDAVPILVPTMSDIGQSASSIHIHVNVTNPMAWPRTTTDFTNDLQDTRSLLSVVFHWIKFDGVIRTFAREWMWRDRSLSPMFAAGPEFLWQEVAWTQGMIVLDASSADDSDGGDDDDGDGDGDGDLKLERYNVPAFFKHVFETYNFYHHRRQQHQQSEGEKNKTLFESVFDDEALKVTLFRWCSLNLRSLAKYGTIEIRRMDATLDSKLINAWTWFCVGFVEKFGDCQRFAAVGEGEGEGKEGGMLLDECLEGASSWTEGLDRLIEAQNSATVEELMEIMTCDEDPVVPKSTFAILLNRSR